MEQALGERDLGDLEPAAGILDASARVACGNCRARALECGGVQRWTGCVRVGCLDGARGAVR